MCAWREHSRICTPVMRSVLAILWAHARVSAPRGIKASQSSVLVLFNQALFPSRKYVPGLLSSHTDNHSATSRRFCSDLHIFQPRSHHCRSQATQFLICGLLGWCRWYPTIGFRYSMYYQSGWNCSRCLLCLWYHRFSRLYCGGHSFFSVFLYECLCSWLVVSDSCNTPTLSRIRDIKKTQSLL